MVGGVCKGGGRKAVIANATSGQLGTVTDATRVSPGKLVGHPIDQGMMCVYRNGVRTWKRGVRVAAWPRLQPRVQ